MDAFYASVEQRDKPALRGKPVLVGGTGGRSVVAAASYEARRFGCRSAMGMVEARRRCPEAIVVAPRMSLYQEVSSHVFSIFHRFTPLVEGLSLDEAFLDLTQSRGLFGPPGPIAERVRAAILAELKLTASAGIGPSKFIAKLASSMNKPNGQLEVASDPESVRNFLRPLPIRRMWGVGKKSVDRFLALGLHTFADLADADPRWLQSAIGDQGLAFQSLARGLDDREVRPRASAQSISVERTVERDLQPGEPVRVFFLALAEELSRRLIAESVRAKTIAIKLRYGDFTMSQKQTTLANPTASDLLLYQVAIELAAKLPKRPVRLVGIGASGLCPQGGTGQALRLLTSPEERRADLHEALLRKAEAKGIRLSRADSMLAASIRRADGLDE
jgi:DNA polymerase IV